MLVSNATVTRSSLDLHVSVHSPASSPGVLHQPVVLSSLSSIANNGNLMVEGPDTVGISAGLTTSAVLINTTSIVTKVGSLGNKELLYI